jgi:hypothetical protein
MNLKEINPPKSKRINAVLESRFGMTIDYDKLTYAKAKKMRDAIAEGLTSFRKSHGIHTAEKNPKYMEMLMVQEGLNSWLSTNQPLMEGELESAEAVLAAKDMVDSIQDMISDASKMLNEQLPPLLDTIRDQIGTAQADSFKNQAQQALNDLMSSLNTARDALDSGARQLAGEEQPQGMNMGGDMSGDMGGDMGGDMSGGEPDLSGSDLDMGDDFEASDAAAGGTEPVGRDLR